MQDANGFVIDKFLDSFGREFCKHEVLWKPKLDSKEYRILSHNAYRMVAQALNLSMKAVLELADIFPEACMELISRYEMCNRVDVGCRLPDWLMTMAPHIRLLNNSMRYNKSAVITTREDLVRALCESARGGLKGCWAGVRLAGEGAQLESSPLQGPRAVAAFASRYCVREADVLPVWHNVYKMCVVKLHALLAAGDRASMVPEPLLLGRDEREVTDLALLHDPDVKQITFLTPAKLRSLVLLFQLIVAAKEVYDTQKRQKLDDAKNEEIMPNALDSENRNIQEKSTDKERIVFCSNSEVRSDENVNINPIIGVHNEPVEISNSDKISDTMSSSNRINSPIEDLSQKYINPSSTQSLLQERVRKCELRRETIDISDATMEESSDYELHTELDLKPDINIICDTSDNEISNKSLEEYSINNIEDSTLLNENQGKYSGNNIIENSDVRYGERESDIALKSQDSDTSPYPKTYWYEESKSSSSEEQRIVWALVYTDFKKRGRFASLVSLQHRWVELLHRARIALLTAWNCDTYTDRNMHPLLLAVVHRFPEIVTECLSPWKRLVVERQIVLESDIKDIIRKYENSNVLLNITENIADRDLVKEYVSNGNIDDVCQSERNFTNKHLSYQINNENPSNVIDNIDTDNCMCHKAQESLAEDSEMSNELNVNNCITTMLEQIDPSKAKVSIIFDEDSDEDDKVDNNMDVRETTTNNFPVLDSEQEECNQTPYAFEKSNKLVEIAMKNIEKELQDKLDYMNNPVNPHSGHNLTEVIGSIKDNNELLNDKETLSNDFALQDELNLLQPKEINFDDLEEENEQKPVIDEKLVNIPGVVITPIEHLPEWKKHSRNGIIKCKNFSVKNFTKRVIINSKQLLKCRPYVATNRDTFDMKDYKVKSENDSEEYESENYMKNEGTMKFKDLGIHCCSGDDVNNGIIYQKYIELYSMPDHMRRNRMKLTRKLKLSRTYFSSKFWSLDSNIELMKLCKPMDIKLSKVIARVAKRVELPDIDEVRRINRSILTAQVSPTPLDTAQSDVQRPSALQGAVNSANNSITSSSDTTTHTNNSLSCVFDSSELLKLLTNYAIEKRITKKSGIENMTNNNNNNNSNFMDSIIETMRLSDTNNISNSTIVCSLNSLQQTALPSSPPAELVVDACNTIMSATDTLNTAQKPTDEELNIPKLNSINNSSLEARASNIHISSDCTKNLYTKHLLKMKISKNASPNLEKTKKLNVCDLKDMILLWAKKYDTDMRQGYNDDMKMNRSSLNLHLKKFEKQQRALVKDISKLSKNLPEYVINLKPKRKITKNTTPAKKRQKISLIKWEQTKDNLKSPSGDTDNISDIANNTNCVVVDEDCEPNLVIDERSLQPSDGFDLNNKINVNKTIIDTSSKKKNDKKEKNRKKAKKKPKQSKKISEEETPILNEYQEWQRQKTMALKYFTIPMSDNSKLTSREKTAQQGTSTSTEHQSNGCQTIISIKRKNTEALSTKSTGVTKCPTLHTNESEVVYISDGSSDDDVQITECNIAATNDTPQNQVANQNICVMTAPLATITQPLYLLVNGSQIAVATQHAINISQDTETINNPLLGKVFSHAKQFSTEPQLVPQHKTQQTQTVLNEQIMKNTQTSSMLPSKYSEGRRPAMNDKRPIKESIIVRDK